MKKLVLALSLLATTSVFAAYDHVCSLSVNGDLSQENLLARSDAEFTTSSKMKSGRTYTTKIKIVDVDKKNVGRIATAKIFLGQAQVAELSATNIDAKAEIFQLSSKIGKQSLILSCTKDF